MNHFIESFQLKSMKYQALSPQLLVQCQVAGIGLYSLQKTGR